MKKVLKYLKNIVMSIVFLLILAVAINAVTKILSKKESIAKYSDMQDTDEFDVLFMGTSHVLDGIFPMELWKDYGIASYNCGGNANQLPTTYYVLDNILAYYHPQTVVIDVYCIESNDKVLPGRTGVDCQHISFDWLPMSKEKVEAVNFLFDDVGTRMEFLIPISIYHERWMDLEENDFNVSGNMGKGADYRLYHSQINDFELIDKTDMNLEDSLGKEYLCKMIEECQEKGIQVLLINIPYPATVEQQQWANSVQVIADRYDVEYLNLQYEDTGVNFDTDCQDADSHLNPSGARKVTDFLGQYLRQNYDVPDRRDDEAYSDWNEDYRKYAALKWSALKESSNSVKAYLSALQDKNLNICLYFNGDSEIMKDDVTADIVQNIADLQRFEEARAIGADYFAVIDNSDGRIYEYVGGEAVLNAEASFAKISLSEKQDGKRTLTINNEELNYLANSRGATSELVIVSYDRDTGESVDWVKFDTDKQVSGS